MSSVIFAINQTEIILATDTLATAYESDYAFFCSKAYSLPHMNMVIAASGATGFLERWWRHLNLRRVYPGIESVSCRAQADLGELWRDFKAEQGLADNAEQAIYQFGVSEFTGEMVAFTHESWGDFAPEEVSFRARGSGMIFAKPDCPVPEDFDGDVGKVIVSMMSEQRRRQASKFYPGGTGKVTIGGEIQIHHLTPAGCSVYKLARFDDYEGVERSLWGDFRATRAQMMGGQT